MQYWIAEIDVQFLNLNANIHQNNLIQCVFFGLSNAAMGWAFRIGLFAKNLTGSLDSCFLVWVFSFTICRFRFYKLFSYAKIIVYIVYISIYIQRNIFT